MRRVLLVWLVLALSGCSLLDPAAPSSTVPPGEDPKPAPQVAQTASPAPEGWAGTVRAVRSGVVHLAVTPCEGPETVGSGSLVAPDLVLTAAHVVNDASYIMLRTETEVTPGYVVAYDASTEIALVRAEQPLAGHVFALAAQDPAEGTEVAALGYPLDRSLSITDGIVSALGIEGELDGELVTDQILTTAAVNPGNSGGPLVLRDGTQVGVVSSIDLLDDDVRAEGRGNAISAHVAQQALEPVAADAPEVTLTDCSAEPPADGYEIPPLEVNLTTDDPRAVVLGQVLAQHGQGINEGAYSQSFNLFTPAMQDRMGGLDDWSAGLATSFWSVLTIQGITVSETMPAVSATLTTTQDPRDGHEGQACSLFTMTYTLVAAPETELGWLIDRAAAPAPTPC